MKHVEGNRLDHNGKLQTVRVYLEQGRIVRVDVYGAQDPDLPVLLPGFIDIHVHGGGGADTMDATSDAFSTIANTHAQFGTTSLLLTTVTEAYERIESVLHEVQTFMKFTPQGARVLGVHLEGPFIHPEKAGAQRRDCIVDPDPQKAEQWFDTGLVKMITLAPERPHAHDVARLACKRDIVVSAGHTTALADDLVTARHAGFSHLTHVCNAMRPFLHRSVGPIGHLIEDETYTADFICDGTHIAGAMLKALLRSVGEERLMLITDAMRATAMGPGTYDLGGLEVQVHDGVCRLADGTLAGSILTMSEAVRTVQKLAGVSLWTAQRLSSLNPAKRLGIPNIGKVEEGYDADLVWLDPDGNVLRTMVGGQIVYEA